MQTEAIFENIAERIITEIQKANNSIYIAVAWFTNKSIFEQLIKKAKNKKVASKGVAQIFDFIIFTIERKILRILKKLFFFKKIITNDIIRGFLLF